MLDFFRDESGKFSSTRLAFLVWALGAFIIWAIVSMKNWSLAGLPIELLAVFGMLMTGKVIQVFGEKKNNA